MLLDNVQVLRVSQDIDQLIIGQEVESWESLSLHCHVIVQRLLNVVQDLIVRCQLVESLEWLSVNDLENDWLLLGLGHEQLERLIDLLEPLGLIWHGFSDIRGLHEDVFKVSPVQLAALPLLHHVTDRQDIFLPLFSFWSQRLHEPGSQNHVDHARDSSRI